MNRQIILIFTSLFILLGLGYSTLTPIFEQSDETLHYPVVKHLADGNRLPIARPGELWNQEGTQPPLYYAIVAATTFWINSDNLPDHLQQNPHWLFTEIRTTINDNQNRVVHGPQDIFPYRNTALAIHFGRWWSLLFGALTVICAIGVAYHFFGDDRARLITAITLVALNPQFIRVSATVSNDSLSALLTTLAVLVTFMLYGTGSTESTKLGANFSVNGQSAIHQLPPIAKPILLGIICGLAILTKLSSLSTIILVGVIIVAYAIFDRHSLQATIRDLTLLGLTTILITGWWFYRNYALYGEWFATDIHLNLAGRGYISPVEIWELRAEVLRAYWGTFGWGQIRLPEVSYQLFFWFTAIGLIGVLVAISKTGREFKSLKSLFPSLFLLFWVAINLALYIRWVMEVGSVSHTRLMFPAIAAISVLLAMGWHTFIPNRLGIWFASGVILIFLLTNLYSLYLIQQAFTPNQIKQANHQPLEATFLDSLTIKSGSLLTDQVYQPGDTVIAEVMWDVKQPVSMAYSVALVMLAPDGTVLGHRETYPGLGLRPTQYLHSKQSFVDRYSLTIEAAVTEPLVAQLSLGLFDYHTPDRVGIPAFDTAGNQIMPIIGQVKVIPTVWPMYQPKQQTEVDFGGVIALWGYNLDSCQQTPSACTLTLYWQSLASVTTNYVVFVHILNEQGEVIDGIDAPPTNNVYPTSWWATGETIADHRPLSLPPEAIALRLGLYDLETGQRLPVVTSVLPSEDDGVILLLR